MGAFMGASIGLVANPMVTQQADAAVPKDPITKNSIEKVDIVCQSIFTDRLTAMFDQTLMRDANVQQALSNLVENRYKPPTICKPCRPKRD